jgi:hypothetical protein
LFATGPARATLATSVEVRYGDHTLLLYRFCRAVRFEQKEREDLAKSHMTAWRSDDIEAGAIKIINLAHRTLPQAP